MSGYVIASKKLGKAWGPYWISAQTYETPGAAKSALTRYRKNKSGPCRVGSDPGDWCIYDELTYRTRVVRKIMVKSLMNPTGPDIEIRSDTPLCCDPSSETYWSM